MQAIALGIALGIVLYVLFKMLIGYESADKRIRRMDMNHRSIKSDRWKREHGKL